MWKLWFFDVQKSVAPKYYTILTENRVSSLDTLDTTWEIQQLE